MDHELDRGTAERRRLGQQLVELRRASGLTQRDLATRLHVERSYVAHSESGRMLPPVRFWESADQLLGAGGALLALFTKACQAKVADATRPNGLKPPGETSAADRVEQRGHRDQPEFDNNSRRRTLEILRQVDAHAGGTRLPYIEPPGRVHELRDFLDRSGQRVYLLKGPAGCGKSRFVSHVSRLLDGEASVQLHSMSTWDRASSNLAEEILRYASIEPGRDALLTFERVSSTLAQTCFVVIDGIASQDHVDQLGVNLERVLRQVTTRLLKFLLVVRTPPDVELSAFPVLAASVHGPSHGRAGASGVVVRWSETEAAHAWSLATGDAEVQFADLPTALRRLATTPLYLRLMVDFGTLDTLTNLTAYQLVDHCVRTIVRRAGPEHATAYRVLAHLAGAEAADLIPNQLAPADSDSDPGLVRAASHAALAPLLEIPHAGRVTFVHDVIREYFVATRIADLVIERGRSHAIVAALNELAKMARTSASARNVLDFTICALDARAPELLTAIALASAVSADSTLPPMLSVASSGAQFATAAVILAAARHATKDEHRDLVRELLRLPALATALGEEYPTWLLGVVREYGSRVWPEVAQHLARFPEAEGTAKLLHVADLDRADDAVFVARHFDLFTGEGAERSALLAELGGHLDWRVRAALTGALGEGVAPRLAHDADYKVRTAAARVIARSVDSVDFADVRDLLLDSNWHVRASILQGVLEGAPRDVTLSAIHALISSDPTWESRRSMSASLSNVSCCCAAWPIPPVLAKLAGVRC
jgi:transcriptional regulator with XRE-family HTH domain